MSEVPQSDWFDAASREVLLACRRDGAITWLDRRAESRLGLKVGGNLVSAASPETDEKVRRFLEEAHQREVRNWELPLVVGATVVTVLFTGRPHEDGVVMLGSLVPDDFGKVIHQVTDAMGEIIQLNRKVESQRRELQERNGTLTQLNRELTDAHQGVLALLRELEERTESLRRIGEARSRVVAHVSHEFRTPVSAIQSLSRMLLDGTDGELSAEQLRQVQFISSSATSLSELVDDILDLSKLEAGKAPLRSERFELTEFLASMRGILRPLMARETAVELVFEPTPAGAYAETDRGKLGQIVRNLVSNALKFTERGEVRVTTSVVDGTLEIKVRDTGMGIAPGDLDRIFEEFAQVSSAQKTRIKGTGLGLPLSRALAERMGGTLTVQSTAGQGSTFTVRVPAIHPDVAAVRLLAGRPLDPARLPALVLEDDRETLLEYDRSLTAAGFQVIPARTVDDAHDALARVHPAVVLLDVLLEGDTSWKFLRHLKETPAYAQVPVFIATITDKEETALGMGADGFFLKPVDGRELLEKLRRIKPR